MSFTLTLLSCLLLLSSYARDSRLSGLLLHESGARPTSRLRAGTETEGTALLNFQGFSLANQAPTIIMNENPIVFSPIKLTPSSNQSSSHRS